MPLRVREPEVAGAAPRLLSSAVSARRPRWCSPCTDPSERPVCCAISVGDRPAMWRRTSTSRWSCGSLAEGLAQIAHALAAELLDGAVVAAAHLLDGDGALTADVVDGDVARHPQDPGEERHVALLVLADHVDQLGEDVLGDVFGLVLVVHDAAHVPADVVCVARVQEAKGLTISLLGRLTARETSALVAISSRPVAPCSDVGRDDAMTDRSTAAASEPLPI